uniref:Uncharacterized protein n=1 Tax=Pseudo-nitzschia australis TaxID=44445 RepID=A0A7S4EKW0_9STRA
MAGGLIRFDSIRFDSFVERHNDDPNPRRVTRSSWPRPAATSSGAKERQIGDCETVLVIVIVLVANLCRGTPEAAAYIGADEWAALHLHHVRNTIGVVRIQR